MSTPTKPTDSRLPRSGARASPPALQPVVVAIDGSEHGRAAVDWATPEAERTGRPLVLLTVLPPEPSIRLVPPHDAEEARGQLHDVRAGIRALHPMMSVTERLEYGEVADVVTSLGHEVSVCVLGRGGHGMVAHLLIGRTTLAAAGACDAPLVLVPEDWQVHDHLNDPIVVGVDPEVGHVPELLWAFCEADARGVDLVVAHAHSTETRAIWDPEAAAAVRDRWRNRTEQSLDRVLLPFRRAYPDVPVRVVQEWRHPALFLARESERAQLLVVGRRSHGRLGPLPLGSTARAVLHHADCPVAVVPPTHEPA